MPKSNPTYISVELVLSLWHRRLVRLFYGKPHMYALGLVGIALLVFFNWQMQRIVGSFAAAGDVLGLSSLLMMISGITFGVITASSWFMAKQIISPPPHALQVLPLNMPSWLKAQFVTLTAGLLLLNALVSLPLFVALGRTLHGHMFLWLVFAEAAVLLYVLFGVGMYVLTERLLSGLSRLTRLRMQSLAIAHIAGQAAIVCLIIYCRTEAVTAFGQYAPGTETRVVIDSLLSGNYKLYAVALGVICLSILSVWMLLLRLADNLPLEPIAGPARRPLSSLLPQGVNTYSGLARLAVRAMLSDKDISQPNFIVLAVLLAASLLVRFGMLSDSRSPMLHGVYDIVLILLFASWGLSVRGRLGLNRSTIYQLPLTPGRFIGALVVTSLAGVVTLYCTGDMLLYAALGEPLLPNLSGITQSALLLICATSAALITGIVTYSGQKSRLSQLPVSIFFAIAAILLLTLLTWLQATYGIAALAGAAAGCVVICLGVSTRYESEHMLDAA